MEIKVDKLSLTSVGNYSLLTHNCYVEGGGDTLPYSQMFRGKWVFWWLQSEARVYMSTYCSLIAPYIFPALLLSLSIVPCLS